MIFDLSVRLGLGDATTKLPAISISQNDIDNVGEYAGAYHVLEMGEHYRDYVERNDMPAFPPIKGFPSSIYYEPLHNKQRAQGVTGNIGEAVAGIIARHVLAIPSSGIAHIRLQKPFRRRQCPDFMVRLNGQFPATIGAIRPLPTYTRFPDWWPLESKARVDGNACDDAARDAFRQLAAYWYSISGGPAAQDVGFGFAVTCAYERNRGICLRVFVPTNVPALLTVLRGYRNYDDFVDAMETDDSPVRNLIHG